MNLMKLKSDIIKINSIWTTSCDFITKKREKQNAFYYMRIFFSFFLHCIKQRFVSIFRQCKSNRNLNQIPMASSNSTHKKKSLKRILIYHFSLRIFFDISNDIYSIPIPIRIPIRNQKKEKKMKKKNSSMDQNQYIRIRIRIRMREWESESTLSDSCIFH